MSHIHIDNAALGPAGSPAVFPPLTQTISHEVVGLFGRNGSGKSSLLAAIAGLRPVQLGAIACDGSIGFMKQGAFGPGASLADALGVRLALEALDRIEAGTARTGDWDHPDWALPSRIERALAVFGLSALALDRSAHTLSGGEQARVKLAALTLQEPDILLMDEPTNDLDDAGRAMVADWLARWEGCALIASHDRALLEGMDRIIELSPVGALSVSGGWSAFEQQRGAQREQALGALEHAQAMAKQARTAHQARVQRQDRRAKQGRTASARRDASKLEINARKGQAERTTARSAAKGEEQIGEAANAVMAAQALVERVVPVRIELPPSRLQSGHRLIEASGVSCQIAGRRLFGPIDLVVTGPQRIAVAGPNGSGKTSLVRVLCGLDEPATGTVQTLCPHVSVLDQHLSLLSAGESALAAMKRHNPAMDVHAAHAALAQFGFRADWSARRVETLSGGERVRLALACLFSGPIAPQMLVLDEPTNHLDIDAIEQLEQALCDYDGAIICISHDRAFREALGLTRTVELQA